MILIVSIILIVLFHYLLIKPLTYWKNHGVQQYSPYRILKDNFITIFVRQGLAQVFEEFYKSFPNCRYFGLYQTFGKTLVIKDVDLIKKITVKDFDHFVDHIQFSPGNEPLWENNVLSLKGKEWKGMRNVLSPAFTSSKLKMMFNLMKETTNNFVDYFERQLKDKACVTVEMKDVFERFSNDIIASTAFGYSCDSLNEPNNEFYMKGREVLIKDDMFSNVKAFVLFAIPKVAKFFGFTLLPKVATNFFWKTIRQNMKERKDKGIVRNDMIQLLMEQKRDEMERKINEIDITSQAIFFFFAGFDSVSALLSFTAYELATHEDIQKRLQKEIDNTLKQCRGTITYEALVGMKYMDMVILESLRKWPSSIVTDRVCTKEYEIPPERPGEVTVYLKKGDIVWLPMFSIHRDPDLFPNPEQFDPERFNEENRSTINSYSYLPFGLGPRICIANRFVLMETKLLFFELLSKFDIVVVKKTPIPMKLSKTYFQLTAEGGFWLGLKLRNTKK